MLRLTLLALSTFVSLNAQLLVDTYAGGAIPSGVPAQSVPLGTISAITWDPSGGVVFSDSTYNVIRRVQTDGTLVTIAGTGVTGFGGDGGPATSALLRSPSLLHYDSSGNLYFVDSGNYRIRRIDTNGVIATIAGDGQFPVAGLDTEGPATARSLPQFYSFAVDSSGIVYSAEQSSNSILRLTAAGSLTMFAQVSAPTGLAIDGAGNVYVSSAQSEFGSILRISPTGIVTTFVTFPSRPFPNSVTLVSTDAAGNVYVVLNGQLLRYAPDGTSTAVATPSSFSQSGAPFPLSIDPQGNLAFASGLTPDAYVAIPIIQEFTNQSVLTTVAGSNPQPAPDGTPLRNAWFLGPLSIAFSHTGDLYIGEFGACLIRKISAAGVLSTFAGTGTCGYPSPAGTAATANLVYPYSIAIDSQDNVWVTDDFLNLYSISQQGALSAMIATPVIGGKGQLAIDAKDRVYVLGLDSLYRVLPGGSYQRIVLPPGTLSGIGADASGNVYFGEGPPTSTYVVNDDATVSLKFPNFGADGLAFDAGGNVWGSVGILDTFNSTGGSFIGAGVGFAGDGGPVQSGSMSAYGSMAFGPDGNLYFAEGDSGTEGYRIRRVTGFGPSAAPVISQGGIVNAVSYAGGAIAPEN